MYTLNNQVSKEFGLVTLSQCTPFSLLLRLVDERTRK